MACRSVHVCREARKFALLSLLVSSSFGSGRKRIREADLGGRMLIKLLSKDLAHQVLWSFFNSVSKALLMLAYFPCSGLYSTCFWCR